MGDFDDLSDGCAAITMSDEAGNDVEFVIISSVAYDGVSYLLVMEPADLADSETDTHMEAVILKEIMDEGEATVFAIVEDDEEFAKAAALFKNSNDDYELEI